MSVNNVFARPGLYSSRLMSVMSMYESCLCVMLGVVVSVILLLSATFVVVSVAPVVEMEMVLSDSTFVGFQSFITIDSLLSRCLRQCGLLVSPVSKQVVE